MTGSEYEENLTFSAWASLVTAVSLKVDVIASDTQFAMVELVALWILNSWDYIPS